MGQSRVFFLHLIHFIQLKTQSLTGAFILCLSLILTSSSGWSASTIPANVSATSFSAPACPAPTGCVGCTQSGSGVSGTCKSNCNQQCTYYTCDDLSTPGTTLSVSSLPYTAYFTDRNCQNRLGTMTLNKLPIQSGDHYALVSGINATRLPTTVTVNSWMCVPHTLPQNNYGTWGYSYSTCDPCSGCGNCKDKISTLTCSNTDSLYTGVEIPGMCCTGTHYNIGDAVGTQRLLGARPACSYDCPPQFDCNCISPGNCQKCWSTCYTCP